MEAVPAPPVIVEPRASDQSIAIAREAMRERVAELERQQSQAEAHRKTAQIAKTKAQQKEMAKQETKVKPVVGQPPMPPTAPPPPKPPTVKTPSKFPPFQGPPSPLSAEQQQRLSELLRKYRADQITPEQYQTERAKILAGP
jgi:hypothetical protein